MKNRLHLAGIVLAISVGVIAPAVAVSVPAGYASSQTELTIPTWFAGFDYLPDGKLIVSDSEEVFILDAEGTRTVAARFEEQGLFGSFVKVAPDGRMVYVGESSLGTISRFDVSAGGVAPIGPGTASVVAELSFTYDMEFDPEGRAFLSAPIPYSEIPTNGLYLLDTDSGETDLLADIQKYSGPLAFDREGNLFYCTSTSYPPEAVESVIVFRKDQIDGAIGGTELNEDDAQTVVSGIYGFSDMVFDSDGDLFGVTASGDIVELFNEGAGMTARRFAHVSPDAIGATVVRFLAGVRDFEPYYQAGGTLTFLESDFGSLYRLIHTTTFPEFRVIWLGREAKGTRVRFPTEEGSRYQVHSSEGLTDGAGWDVLGDELTGTGEPRSVLDSGGDQAGKLSPNLPAVRERFYKVQRIQ